MFCKEGYIFKDRQPHWTICSFKESNSFHEWSDLEKIGCIPNSCNQHPDFDLVNLAIKKEFYDIGEMIIYTCPNGYMIRIKCITNRSTGFGEWDFKGSCKGTYLGYFKQSLRLRCIARILVRRGTLSGVGLERVRGGAPPQTQENFRNFSNDFLRTSLNMHYFRIVFIKFKKQRVTFSRVWTKSTNCWKSFRKFWKFLMIIQ